MCGNQTLSTVFPTAQTILPPDLNEVSFKFKKLVRIVDESPMMFNVDTSGPLLIYVKGKRIIVIPHLFWTYDRLARALPHLNNDKENFDVKLLHNPYRLEITTKLENQHITITEAVAASFGVTINEYDLVANETLSLPITPLHGLGPFVTHVKECYLKRNIYKHL